MNITELKDSLEYDDIGQQMYDLIAKLYPICRSITGDGLRKTLRVLQGYISLEIHEVPSGIQVFDWTVPKEWNVKDAYVKNSRGEKIIDYQKCNLHVLNYSSPIKQTMPLHELREHLYTLPDHPDWIPYKTSYYSENWGFCLSHKQFSELENGNYEVVIDSTLKNGHLTYGECYLKGEQQDEVLISCHACHPSLCNDNLSGISLSTMLAKHLGSSRTRYSYRFLFIPGTIGSITWLSINESRLPLIKHGLVVACVGDSGKFTYKKSRRGDAEIDRAVIHVLKHSNEGHDILDFSPYGYDERQYCSPAFNLPVGSLTRTPHGRYPEYHTSADNLDFVKPEFLAESFSKYLDLLSIVENNRKYLNCKPKCEPQLGKRGIYSVLGGRKDTGTQELAMLWVLNLSDGKYTLLDIANRSGLEFAIITRAARILLEHGLLQKCCE